MRAALLESKLRESLEFFNDTPSFGLRRDRRRTSYQLAAEIDAVLASHWRRRLDRALAAAVQFADGAFAGLLGVIVLVGLLLILPVTL